MLDVMTSTSPSTPPVPGPQDLTRALPLVTPAYGGDWNPEQWDPAVVDTDIQLMVEAGVTLVTLGVFSWARLEPVEGRYDLDWLADVIDRLHAAGIMVDLATGTASPPAWMATDHPESLPVTAEGTRLGFGSRQQYCPSSRVYRERSRALAGRLAQRFGAHPGVVLWHVGNEYACHVHECFCEQCASDFRDWLRERHGDIEGLNRDWGTDFWSQRYASFDHVTPPRAMPTFHNPAQALDWRRFCDHQVLSCLTGEVDAIRAHSGRPVTTNFMGAFPWLDYREWARHLDLVADDSYPDPADPASAHEVAWQGDLMRGLGDGAPWLLMEQSPGAVQWRRRNSPKRPGQFLLWSLSRIAHGADGVLQFQWRQSRQGAETFHAGMVPHSGRSSRTWDEVVATGHALGRLAPVLGGRVHADAAVLIDWDSEWARRAAVGPVAPGEPFAAARAWHRTLWEAGIAVDVIGPDSDLSGYSLVVVPELFEDRPDLSARLAAAAGSGAQVLVTGPTGVVHQDMSAVLDGYLGSLRDLLGVRVVDHAPLTGPVPPPQSDGAGTDPRGALVDRLTRAVATPASRTWIGVEAVSPSLVRAAARLGTPAPDLRAGMWAEVLAPAAPVAVRPAAPAAVRPAAPVAVRPAAPSAAPVAAAARPDPAAGPDEAGPRAQWPDAVEVVAVFDGRGGGTDLAGSPALTRRAVGEDGGGAWYVATDLDAVSRAAVLGLVGAHGRLRPVVADLPDGVEAQRRGDLLFLLNHSDTAAEVAGVVGTDLLGGAACTGHVVLAPRSGMVVAP